MLSSSCSIWVTNSSPERCSYSGSGGKSGPRPCGSPQNVGSGGENALLGREMRFWQNELNKSRVEAVIALSNRAPRAASERNPPFQAFKADRAFPSTVLGPVDFFQGQRTRILSACVRRASSVQRGMVKMGVCWLSVSGHPCSGFSASGNVPPCPVIARRGRSQVYTQ